MNGRVICILGPDGVGKSTLIDGLIGQLHRRGIKTDRHHWRIRPHSPLESVRSPLPPHQKPSFGPLLSFIKLCLYLIDGWRIRFLYTVPALRHGRWQIIDRGPEDLLCDPSRYRYGGPLWMVQIWSKLMPASSITIILLAPAPVILLRKQELPSTVLDELLKAYGQLKGKRHFIIDANASATVVLEQALRLIGVPPLEGGQS